MKSELVKPSHLARKAVVYIRQSTPHQVVSNQESLRLQYALGQRARELGWHEADIDVIDTDLGLSGASAAQRGGFKELVGRVGLSEVGLILSIDVTRLARNCSDWYPLLDICGLRGCLIADRDGVYDPGSPNGRLLLGLKGTISELELHTIRSRLTAGLLAKAARGELALTLPIGLLRDPSGMVLKDPDMAVQERLGLVFELFLKFRTVAKVMRVLNDRGLDLPRRDRHGDLRWARATVSSVAAILKNPAYAGAFVYGRTRIREATREGASPAKAPRPIENWRIVVKDRYPAFNKVDPDNRLVAAELERRWEAALSEVRAAEEALAQQAPPQTIAHIGMGKSLEAKVVSLAGRLPQIWTNPATTDAHRKALLRCLVEKVVLDRREHDVASVRVVWRGGAVTELDVKMKVNSIAKLTRGPEMRDRVLTLARNGMPDTEIATVLTGEGHRSPDCQDRVLPITVRRIRHAASIRVTGPRSRWSHNVSSLSPPELASRLNIPVNWLYVQIRQKRPLVDQQPNGAYLFQDSPAVLDSVPCLRNHTVSVLDLRICQPHQEGYQHG